MIYTKVLLGPMPAKQITQICKLNTWPNTLVVWKKQQCSPSFISIRVLKVLLNICLFSRAIHVLVLIGSWSWASVVKQRQGTLCWTLLHLQFLQNLLICLTEHCLFGLFREVCKDASGLFLKEISQHGQGDLRKIELHQNKPVVQDLCGPSLNWPI